MTRSTVIRTTLTTCLSAVALSSWSAPTELSSFYKMLITPSAPVAKTSPIHVQSQTTPPAQAPAQAADQSNGRALPSPLPSPPFPDSDWLGFPLIGAPYSGAPSYPLEKALFGDKLSKQNMHLYGWINPSFTLSSSHNSDAPLSYGLVPNKLELDQAVLVFEKQPDTVQTDHVDYGFRSVNLYGTNYRYTIMQGIFSNQLLKYNRLYGMDPVELYGIVYLPKVAQGMVIRAGRYISPPDIEAQLTPDNYLYSHSLMFTVDPYTFIGVNAMVRYSKQWEVMFQVHGGNDMAPWEKSSSPNVGILARYASPDGRDGFWGGLNSIGAGKSKDQHDDLQQFVMTWGHKFNEKYHMMTEGYYMWEFDGNVGGTANYGPTYPFGGGGGPGAFLPGRSDAIGLVNYFQILVSGKDYVSIRNDYLDDQRGWRTGYSTAYSSHTIGYVRFLTPSLMIRPELRYEHAYGARPYDNGTRRDQWTLAADLVWRF